MSNDILFNKLDDKEKLIYNIVRESFRNEMEMYFGITGDQHRIDHLETLPKIKDFLNTREADLISKNKFWEEIKKDLYKFLTKLIAVGILGLILVSLGIISWPTLIKLIG